ncbi:MAG: hypothetical protein JKY93_07585 [Gammaproteobacteria bacterium]|nr:hypothetical protein [Gammaproteobacteria bacterium]
MPKSHVVKLTITNNSGYAMTKPSSWFDSGRVADGWNIPTTIASGGTDIVEMYERDNASAGCSGYINYTLNAGTITVAFSNPASGSNKLGCGTGGKSVWNDMESHDYNPFHEKLTINHESFTANESCTGGDVNQATVTLTPAASQTKQR